MGISAGGYGAMSMAIGHPDYFGAVATMGGALNLRYYNADERLLRELRPGDLPLEDAV